MEERTANIICGKNGQGYNTYKIALPNCWIHALELSNENREVSLRFEDNIIAIKKREN